jgi:hypothetical protein
VRYPCLLFGPGLGFRACCLGFRGQRVGVGVEGVGLRLKLGRSGSGRTSPRFWVYSNEVWRFEVGDNLGRCVTVITRALGLVWAWEVESLGFFVRVWGLEDLGVWGKSWAVEGLRFGVEGSWIWENLGRTKVKVLGTSWGSGCWVWV